MSALPISPNAGPALLRSLASTRLTLVLLAALAAAIVAHTRLDGGAPHLLAAAFAAGAANLAAALAAQPRLRADLPLFAFHAALLALLLLLAVGRLTCLTGTVELAKGELFEGQLGTREAGLLHRDRLARLRFVNDGFTVQYAQGWRRGRTHNDVRVFGEDGGVTQFVIGDIDPLVVDGYRFYTTSNKGFAPVFRWVPRDGRPMERGTVHLPSYPLNEHRQAQSWRLPGSVREIWVMLDLERPAIDPIRADEFRIPERHRLVVVIEGVRRELTAGDSVTLGEGVLVYEGLTSWMGYRVFYDPTLPWLLAAALAAIASLALFFWRRFAAARGSGRS
jgi:cytochrome c biogenesis protein